MSNTPIPTNEQIKDFELVKKLAEANGFEFDLSSEGDFYTVEGDSMGLMNIVHAYASQQESACRDALQELVLLKNAKDGTDKTLLPDAYYDRERAAWAKAREGLRGIE